ncbi:MAG: hypothetical protein J6X42_01720 [Alphaproteobacteria bacterium]|nr:hypothetical protein [Alphaproteobacteria bacterium]
MKKLIYILVVLFISSVIFTAQATESSDNIAIQGCINCDIDADVFLKIGNRIYFVLDRTNKSAVYGHFSEENTTDTFLIFMVTF